MTTMTPAQISRRMIEDSVTCVHRYVSSTIAIDFIKRQGGNPTQLLCEWIESHQDTNKCRLECESYLRLGISKYEHHFLEERPKMNARGFNEAMEQNGLYGSYDEYLYHTFDEYWYEIEQSMENADPAMEQPWRESSLVRLPYVEFADAIDPNDLIDLEDNDEFARPDKLPPDPGFPTSLEGMSVFDSIMVLRDFGVLNEAAAFGLATRFVEWYCPLEQVLCEHIDAQGGQQDFARVFYEKTNF